jgi:hypothetical protein
VYLLAQFEIRRFFLELWVGSWEILGDFGFGRFGGDLGDFGRFWGDFGGRILGEIK